jgi:hypothetical protein
LDLTWNACRAVTDHAAVTDWLRANGLDPRAVAARDLARADDQHLILPLLDGEGQIADLQRVPVIKKKTRGARSSVPPLGSPGLVMANLIGRALLLVGAAPDWWTWRTVLIVDELLEFLSWGSSYADFEDVPALFHLPPSGWTENHACRIPAGTRVIVRTGNHHVPTLLGQLQQRCEVVVRR